MNILELCGLVENGHCGYCQERGKQSLGEEEDDESGASVSLGIWAHNLSTSQYQSLLDCGWRRSGSYIYKPIMDRTCCPQYTIRLDSSKFFLSHSQKRVLRVMHEYLKNGVRPKCGPVKEIDIDQPDKNAETSKGKSKDDPMTPKEHKDGHPTKKKTKRRQRCIDRWRAKGVDVEEMQAKRRQKEEMRRRSIESYLLPPDDSWRHKLEVQLVSTHSAEFREREEESFQLYSKYQSTIHNDDESALSGFKRFLVSDPFESQRQTPFPATRPPFGAYHQWYLLDGKLIAVGVVDILPHCLSSKYMFYDPAFNFLSLGTYTALREIEFLKRLAVERPTLKYYYMGYYIQSCPKMRYKGKFQPSELLCDKSFQWVPLSECTQMFAASDSEFVVFRPGETVPRKRVQDLELIVNRRPVRYSDLSAVIPGFAEKEPAKAKSELSLLASLLPAVPLRNSLLLFVGEINKLGAAVARDDSQNPSSDEDE